MTVELHNVDGSISEVEPDFSVIAKAIGGGKTVMLEVVYLATGVLLVDEEGLCKGLSYNRWASSMSRRDIVGDVAYVPKKLVKKVLG